MFLFQVLYKMESNISKGDKTNFAHFVQMTLQNKMYWKTLAFLLIDLAPTLNETREIISILLKELEAFQATLRKKDKLLENHSKGFDNFEKFENNLELNTLENVTITDGIKSNSTVETEGIENDIEVLEVDKEIFNEEIHFEPQRGTNNSDISEYKNDSMNKEAISSLKLIDNECLFLMTKTMIQKLKMKQQHQKMKKLLFQKQKIGHINVHFVKSLLKIHAI